MLSGAQLGAGARGRASPQGGGRVVTHSVALPPQEKRKRLHVRRLQVPEPLTEPQRLAAQTGAPRRAPQRLQGEGLPEVQGLQVPRPEATQVSELQLLALSEPLTGAGRQRWEVQEEKPLLQGPATGALAVLRAHGPSLRAGPPWAQQAPEVRCGVPEGGPALRVHTSA